MPQEARQMTEANERIASLETNMGYVLNVLAKREEYQNSVLKSLTTIEIKQDQSLNYQKTCDAERNAHATRLGLTENSVEAVAGTLRDIRESLKRLNGVEKSIDSLEKNFGGLENVPARMIVVEKHIARGSTIWWFVLRASGAVSGIVALAASTIVLWRHP